MAAITRFGILGCGNIARIFSADLKRLPSAALYACGSRSLEKALAFKEKEGAEKAYGSYEELVNDPDVDVVYIASPHSHHSEHTLLALEAGKHVLCEKPVAVNLHEARLMAEKAREKNLFLMEAMWMRFLPVINKVEKWIEEGLIGDVLRLTADLGFYFPFDPASRLYDPDLAGGALLDVGVYPLHLAALFLGTDPVDMKVQSCMSRTGVDEQTVLTLKYARGSLAVLSCAINCNTHCETRIDGTRGTVLMKEFWKASEATLMIPGSEPVKYSARPGYDYQAGEVIRCLAAGRTESRIMPLDESLAVMKMVDEAREQVGLKYKNDNF
ncbi:MAG: Gfo/Idh/MocA family oxidoreductase [Spirochaetales bacterium]|nr:Gfo/Idh/MocA family oxidoreductase [Spirochaetales bacterium]